jgi:hypothetical protein
MERKVVLCIALHHSCDYVDLRNIFISFIHSFRNIAHIYILSIPRP